MAFVAMCGLMIGGTAQAQSCIEQIVALQQRLQAISPPAPQPPTEAQSIGAQLNEQPTPSSVAAAEGKMPPLAGPAAALSAAQNFQAAGNEQACLKAVNEARQMMDGK